MRKERMSPKQIKMFIFDHPPQCHTSCQSLKKCLLVIYYLAVS